MLAARRHSPRRSRPAVRGSGRTRRPRRRPARATSAVPSVEPSSTTSRSASGSTCVQLVQHGGQVLLLVPGRQEDERAHLPALVATIRGHVADLLLAQLPAERRHPAAAVRHLLRARGRSRACALSRFGPTWPLDFAAESVWHEPQPAEANTFAPAAASAFGGDRRALRRRRGRVLPVEPDRARPPDADQHGEEQAAGGGQHPAREAVQPHDRHLRGEGAVDRAAEQRVSEHARARILEAELEDAVVGDGQRQTNASRPDQRCTGFTQAGFDHGSLRKIQAAVKS